MAWGQGASINLLPQIKSLSALPSCNHPPRHAQWKGFLCVLKELGEGINSISRGVLALAWYSLVLTKHGKADWGNLGQCRGGWGGVVGTNFHSH